MTNDIDALVRRMSRIAERLFEEDGQIPPMWLVDLTDGKQELYGTPFNGDHGKEALSKHMSQRFQSKGVWRYACAVECWTSESEGRRPSLQPDRKEAVLIYAQDRATERLGMRDIVRADGGAYLTKLEMCGAGNAWFTRLLPEQGMLQ